MSDAAELQRLLDGQPRPECVALKPYVVERADFGNVQGDLAVGAQPPQ